MICRVCDGNKLEKVLDLGNQPWCNHFLKPEEVGTEPTYPLRVVYCHDCSTTQLDYTVKKEIMFGDHTYLSGVTKSLSSHFKSVADEIDAIVPHKNRKKNSSRYRLQRWNPTETFSSIRVRSFRCGIIKNHCKNRNR